MFIDGNNDEAIAVSKIEKFIAKYYLSVSSDTDEYMSGELKTSRKVWVYLTKFVVFYCMHQIRSFGSVSKSVDQSHNL